MNFTDEQKAVLAEPGNCVVIAAPGSGKTATISALIRSRLENLSRHKGIVAISYTNRATNELRQRVKAGGVDTKSSFFGTIDRFFISEIIIPFGRRLWAGLNELRIVRAKELDVPHSLRLAGERIDPRAFPGSLDEFGRLFTLGIVVLESVGFLACHIFTQSAACRKYLAARFTDVVVDEYQDSDEWQHQLFLLLVELGVRGVAVGDLDQSIFSFAEKYPRFLRELANNDHFTLYQLTVNHRCHPAIIEYAKQFLWPDYVAHVPDEKRVFHAHVDGSEAAIGGWLNTAVPEALRQFDIATPNSIGILVRNNRTADLVKRRLTIPFRHSVTTTLDEDNSPSSSAFRTILSWLFNPKETRRGFLEDHLDPIAPKMLQRRLVRLLSSLQETVPFDEQDIGQVRGMIISIAEIITARRAAPRSISRLDNVLRTGEWIHYAPAETEEVQLMTIYKAKGGEFDIVFHLDLYEYVIPRYKKETDPEEANLHYVALTRPRLACVLCTSTYRHNSRDEVVAASLSQFLYRRGLGDLRARWPAEDARER